MGITTYLAAALLAAAALGALLTAPLAASAATIIVDVGKTGDYETIQEGIDAASEGDTVLVYPGTYTGEGNRDIEFGTKNIVLRGTGGAAMTIIDPGFGVYRCINFRKTGQDTTCVIDGFTMQGGRLQEGYLGGAGISIDGTAGTGPGPASPKFINCVVRDNYNALGAGGGVYMNWQCSPVFRNVVFEGNYSYTGGGGVYATWNCNATFSGCTFRDNENPQFGYGGGLACKFESNATLVNCVFETNIATNGAGLSCTDGASPTLTNVTFIGNSAGGGGAGGGLYCSEASSPTLTNVTFYANRVVGVGDGECLYAIGDTLGGSHPVLINSLFAYSGYAPASRGSSDDARGLSFYCDATSGFDVLECCSFGNVSGNDICTVSCADRVPDLICEDPLFCDPGSGDLTVAATSPCLPGNNEWGVLIGAHGEGCTQPSVQPSSWGAIKALYR